MNSKKLKYWVDFQVYDKPEAKTLIEKVKHQLGESSKEAGKRDAESNLPSKKEKLLPYIGHLLSQIQQLINDLRSIHKADENVSQSISKQERILQQARNERDEIQTKYSQAEREYQIYKDGFPSSLAIIVSGIILLLGLMEGLISHGAIRSFVPHYFTALFTALVYGMSLTILAHQILSWWYLGKTQIIKWLIRILVVGGISGAFLMMGLLRSGQIHLSSLSLEESGSGTIFTYADSEEALLFTLISWLVFLPAVLLTKFAPTKEQWFGIFKARHQKKALKGIERKLQAQLDCIACTQEEIENLHQFQMSRDLTAKRDEEEVLSLVEHVKSRYVQSNIRYRLDKGAFPSCFEEEIHYPITTYFYNSKTSKK